MVQSTAPRRSRFSRTRRLLATVCALGLGVLTFGCGHNLQLAGTVERTALELAAPDAELVVDVPVKVGEHVAAGQVVVKLDTTVAEADLKAYQAGRAAAAALLKEAEGEYARVARLRKAGVSTAQSLDEAERKRDEALAQVAEKEARIAQATKRLSDLTIRSATPGVVDQIAFDKGERAPAGGVVAVVLSDEAPWVRVWLPARAAARVTPGTPARVEVVGLDHTLEGRVRDISREPEFTPHFALTERESAHLVYETRIDLVNAPPQLRPGLPAQVRLRLGAGPAAAAAAGAGGTGGGGR